MKDFKKGDWVRIKDTPNSEWRPQMPPLSDAIFKVEGTQNDKLILSAEGSDAVFICDAKYFELVESPDQPKNMTDMSFEPISEAQMVRDFGKDWWKKARQCLINPQNDDNYIQVGRNGIEMLAEEEPDQKTAFLSELQRLLRKYNVSICHAINIVGNGIIRDMIEFDFGDDSILYIKPENHPLGITPDNIFNYEK